MEVFYESVVAEDGNGTVVKDGAFQAFELSDVTFSNPLPLLSSAKLPMSELRSTAQGVFPGVYVVSENLSHVFRSGPWAWRRNSFDGAMVAVQEARAEAVEARVAAEDARVAAEDARAEVEAPTDTAVDRGIERADLPSVVRPVVASEVQPLLDPTVKRIAADYIASNPAVVDAAAAAVNANPKIAQLLSVTTGETVSNLAFSLVQGFQPTLVTLTTVRGAPVYGAPAKFGKAQSGGVTQASGAIPDSPVMTLDGWFMQPALPVGTAVDIIWSVNGFMYVCIEPATGYLSYVHSGNTKRSAQVNVCDGQWHHAAVELTRSGADVTLTGMWLDGNLITGAVVSGGLGVWSSDLTIGGNPSRNFDMDGSVDSLRISNQSVFPAAGFTPPVWPITPSASTAFTAPLDTSQATKYVYGYPPRPTNAPGGSVTYTGKAQPTTWLTNDRWVKV